MSEEDLIFADATANFDEAKIILLGVPFDGTSSHRPGSASAPQSIRKESYNYESFLYRYKFNIENVKIHDMGDCKVPNSVHDLYQGLTNVVKEPLQQKKFLITIGGEHSITVPVVKTHLELKDHQDFGIIYLDAHLDFRDSYLDEKLSHACVARRLFDLVGKERLVEIGIRSFSAEEAEAAKKNKLKFYNAEIVNEMGMKKIIEESLDYLGVDKLYLTLDIDVLDPSYAPGVGNPEYFGMTPWQIRECIEVLGEYLIGADLVEVSPFYDNGNTSALAAQLIQIVISQIK